LRTYQYKLSDSPSLLAIKEAGQSRVIDDIGQTLTADTEHTRWVKSMGYRSSYTVPIYHQGVFEGFLFFDSRQLAAFTPETVDRLGAPCLARFKWRAISPACATRKPGRTSSACRVSAA
jgi:hypothetical protein